MVPEWKGCSDTILDFACPPPARQRELEAHSGEAGGDCGFRKENNLIFPLQRDWMVRQ